ncbi:MAG: hypothetical protein JJV97_03265 [SAR324 cluster bacterium]|nr:hypothetical protein [SAR324 cluster bacterium]
MKSVRYWLSSGKISAAEYSTKLYHRSALAGQINSNLVEAFRSEFLKRGFFKKDTELENSIDGKNYKYNQPDSLESKHILSEQDFANFLSDRVLQTAHHQCLTNGLGFNGIDLTSILGMPSGKAYLVGTYSGVPFSNNAWSGALCFNTSKLSKILNPKSSSYKKVEKSIITSLAQGSKEKKIQLLPSRYKDNLIFDSILPADSLELFNALQDNLKARLVSPEKYHYFTDWGLDFCQSLQRYVLDKGKVYYFDINRVIKDFLIRELESDSFDSMAVQILIDEKIQKALIKIAPQLVLFSLPNTNEKGVKTLKIADISLSWLGNPKLAAKEIRDSSLCPATFLVFSLLCFENKFRCLGSFLQVDYLEEFFEIYHKLGSILNINLDLSPDITDLNGVTIARLPASLKKGYSLDLFADHERFDKEYLQKQPINYFWQNIKSSVKKKYALQ